MEESPITFQSFGCGCVQRSCSLAWADLLIRLMHQLGEELWSCSVRFSFFLAPLLLSTHDHRCLFALICGEWGQGNNFLPYRKTVRCGPDMGNFQDRGTQLKACMYASLRTSRREKSFLKHMKMSWGVGIRLTGYSSPLYDLSLRYIKQVIFPWQKFLK